MKRPSSKTQFITFAVEGSHAFPIDMLRYDACYPDSEQDSGKVEYSDMYDSPRGSRVVWLKHRVIKHENLDNYPSPRWPSFGWRVLPETIKYEI